jgi:hypothetical protein
MLAIRCPARGPLGVIRDAPPAHNGGTASKADMTARQVSLRHELHRVAFASIGGRRAELHRHRMASLRVVRFAHRLQSPLWSSHPYHRRGRQCSHQLDSAKHQCRLNTTSAGIRCATPLEPLALVRMHLHFAHAGCAGHSERCCARASPRTDFCEGLLVVAGIQSK